MEIIGLLATEAGGERSLWDPTILGILVFISGVVLFCGSAYLLLATNLGARLGFLIAAAALTGFMVLLSLIWMSTATPLNSPRGRIAEWKAVEVTDAPAESSIAAVRSIQSEGDRIPGEDLTELRPAVDAALVIPGEGDDAEPGEFATFSEAGDLIIDDEELSTYVVGGASRWIFWHEPRYAAVEFCIDDATDDEVEFGEPVPDPQCDPARSSQFLVLERDLGSLRQPPFMYFLASLVLFGLSLLGLHWREQDERRRASATVEPS